MKQLISSRNIKVVLAVVLAITCINGIGLNLNDHPIQVPDGTSSPQSKTTSTSSIPDYTGLASVVLSDGSGLDISNLPSETVLSELDSLGRCGTVEMVVTPDTMPAEGERRGSIGMVKPSGWHTVRDDSLDGKTFKTDMVAWYTYRIPLLRACLLMCIASLFNPYGFGGAIYTVLSMGAASYGNVISEMRPFISSPNDSYGIVCTMVCIVIPVAIAIIKGKVPNTGVLAFWIAAVVMGILKIRCFWIAWTVSFAFCAYLCGIDRTGIHREEEGIVIRLMPVLFIGVLLATSVLNASNAACSSDGTTASGWSAFDQETAPIVDALRDTDTRIFSSDDTLMNYFEWEDIKVSYDMRPEIWAKAIAGERTHDDYKRYVDVVNAKSFKTLNDGYWDVAIIRKDEQRLFEKEVRGSEKIVSNSRYCLYRLK